MKTILTTQVIFFGLFVSSPTDWFVPWVICVVFVAVTYWTVKWLRKLAH